MPTKMLALIVLLSAVMVECTVIICGFSFSIRPDQQEPVVELLWVQNFSAQKNADALNISLTLTGTEVESDGTLPLFVVESGEVFGVNLV